MTVKTIFAIFFLLTLVNSFNLRGIAYQHEGTEVWDPFADKSITIFIFRR